MALVGKFKVCFHVFPDPHQPFFFSMNREGTASQNEGLVSLGARRKELATSVGRAVQTHHTAAAAAAVVVIGGPGNTNTQPGLELYLQSLAAGGRHPSPVRPSR